MNSLSKSNGIYLNIKKMIGHCKPNTKDDVHENNKIVITSMASTTSRNYDDQQ
jgi:hypothetical protein